jgi:hypothetical protein
MTDARSPDHAAEREDDSRVVAHASRPDRTVFTEEGNTDGWIASDLVMSVER